LIAGAYGEDIWPVRAAAKCGQWTRLLAESDPHLSYQSPVGVADTWLRWSEIAHILYIHSVSVC